MRLEDLPTLTACHLVKSIDLNHHGTLFAGRMAEWVVEAGFMSARAALDCLPEAIVCVAVDRLNFRRSVPKGSTVEIVGQAAHVGRSSVTIRIEANLCEARGGRELVTAGYATFVHIDSAGAKAHGRQIKPPADADARGRWDMIVAQRT